MTEWVTLKVPEADREQAAEYKPDGATWGDCVVQGAEALAILQERKPANMSWKDYLRALVDESDQLKEIAADDRPLPPDAIEVLEDEIRKAQELAEQARDAAQAVEAEVGQR